MKKIIVLIIVFFSLSINAQTKLIAHKSHSGGVKTFKKVYQQKLFDIQSSNFGLPGNRNIIILEKVKVVNDSTVEIQIKESKTCFRFGTNYKDLYSTDFSTKKIILKNDIEINKKKKIIRN